MPEMVLNLSLDLLGLFPDIILDLRCNISNSLLVSRITHEDSRDLDDADEAEEEVDGGEAIHINEGVSCESTVQILGEGGGISGAGATIQVVLGLDNQAPSGPDQAGAGEGQVLCE